MEEEKIRCYLKYQKERENQEENNLRDYVLLGSPDC